MALSREELRVLDRKEGSETREQCVRRGCVWGEVGGKEGCTHTVLGLEPWGLHLSPAMGSPNLFELQCFSSIECYTNDFL